MKITKQRIKKILRMPPHKLAKEIIKRSIYYGTHFFRKRTFKGKLSDKKLLSKTKADSFEELINTLQKNPLFDAETAAKQIPMESKRNTIKEANEFMKHNFDLLGSGKTNLGEKINWNRDFVSGYKWPKGYYLDAEIIRFNDSSDIKIPWELSRCHHFTTLGKAYLYTKDEKYAKEFASQLKSWWEQNPVDYSVNWAISMEVAIRAINWIWAYYFFKDSKQFDLETKKEFIKSLYFHAEHIYSNIEYNEEVRGNHYLSNGIGLIYLGLFLKDFRESNKWVNKGKEIIFRSMKDQVLDDGVDFEKAISYQRLVAEFFLHFCILSGKAGMRIPEWFESKLEKMVEFICYYTKPDGKAPLIGDADDGRLVRLAERDDINDHRHILSTEAVLFGRGDFKKAVGHLHEETLWLLGNEAATAWNRITAKDISSKAFSKGDFYIMRNRKDYLIVDGGELGLGKRGGHGHNDTLSFELYAGDKTFITDSGTYTYTGNYKERNRFRGTNAHNTIAVDGKEIAPFDEKDLWYIKDITNAKVLEWSSSGKKDVFAGRHEGYKRLGAIHTREIVFDKGKREWIIKDRLTGRGEHKAELFLHFAPMNLKLDRKNMKIKTETKGTNIEIIPMNTIGLNIDIKKDYVSYSYGMKTEAPVVVMSKKGKLPVEFVTKIRVY